MIIIISLMDVFWLRVSCLTRDNSRERNVTWKESFRNHIFKLIIKLFRSFYDNYFLHYSLLVLPTFSVSSEISGITLRLSTVVHLTCCKMDKRTDLKKKKNNK